MNASRKGPEQSEATGRGRKPGGRKYANPAFAQTFVLRQPSLRPGSVILISS